MKINGYFVFVALSFALMLFISVRYFRSAGNASVGITSASGFKINSERSATVYKIWVVPGQQVKAGDVLVELTSFELDLELDRLQSRIVTLQSERSEKSKLARSEIAYVKAEQGVEIEKINSSIAQLESELELNKKLTSEFTDSQSNERDNPTYKKIEALKLQRTRYEEAIAIKISDIRQETETEETLLTNQIRLLEKEYALLQGEKSNLNKVATTQGVVDNVYVKEGEQVNAFTSLLSVNPIHPATVVGYLVGKKTALPVGTEVVVRAQENKGITATGKIIGYGSMVALPDILQKSTAVTAYGREFFIEISQPNGFANGERVLIR
jgi:multidrug resistance efflux pump